MAKAQGKPDIKPHVRERRKQRALELLGARLDAERRVKVIEALVPVEGHPADAPALERAKGEVTDRSEEFAAVVGGSGISEAELLATVRQQRKTSLRDQIEEWTRNRDLHEDMATNPDLYGGVDMGGAPLDAEVQRRFVLEYDAAIEAARAELESLKTS